MAAKPHPHVKMRIRTAPTTLVALLLCLTTVSIGCAAHREVPPGGHREWGACAAIGALSGAIIGAGVGLGIAYAVAGKQSSTVALPPSGPPPSQTTPLLCNQLISLGCQTPGGTTTVKQDNPKRWLGALGAIPGAFAGGLVGHYLCDPVVAAAALPPPPPPPRIVEQPPPPEPISAPPQRIVLRGVHFAFNRYDIRSESEATLDTAAAVLREHPNMQVDVNGYCDIIGSEAYNQALSIKRAEAVRNFLVAAGVSPSQLVVHGYGKTHFVASNDTDAGRAQNRRVELVPTSAG